MTTDHKSFATLLTINYHEGKHTIFKCLLNNAMKVEFRTINLNTFICCTNVEVTVQDYVIHDTNVLRISGMTIVSRQCKLPLKPHSSMNKSISIV